ncbi:MAG TPA: GGDEF domain-containing protein [Acidobacteriaceae bacterium]|jgi:diguanylate cyclase (GGDEF)-like protein|nr:GGDEF domain-containing protein [Acidobacteriaceae bacterium]
MTRPSPFVVMVLVCSGTGLLCASLVPMGDILRLVCNRSLRWKWRLLTALVLAFIPGYAAFAVMRVRSEPSAADVIVAAILFFGGCFVAGVAFLSRQTAKDLLRIAGLERDAYTDPLTQLFNRRYLSHRFNEETFRAHRYETELAVILVDIDHFKRVNDTWGHRAGDEVLRQVAQRIRAELRSGDIAVRYGGDELLVMAPHSDGERGTLIAERIRREVKDAIITANGSAIAITASIGVAALLADEDAGTLIQRVDCTLYQAKQEGRDRVCVAQGGDTPCRQGVAV